MPCPNVLITNKVPEKVTEPIHGIANLIMGDSKYDPLSRERVLELAPGLTAIINQAELNVDEELLNSFPDLKIVANVSKGTDNLNKELMASRGVWATNAPGYFAYPVAEYVIAGILLIARGLHVADQFVRSESWKKFQPGRWDGLSLAGKKLGVIGYGDIGHKLSKLAECLGMEVSIYDLNYKNDKRYKPLEGLLKGSDVVSIHVPLNEHTKHLIDKDKIYCFKKGAILVNTSRGQVVDESAIIEALDNNHLKGAVLDVFEHEPEVSKSFFEKYNVLLTPHIAGGTMKSRYHARLLAFQNVAEVLKGKSPKNPVNNLIS